MNESILSLLIFIPVVGALAMLVFAQFEGKDNPEGYKWIAAIATGVQLLLGIWFMYKSVLLYQNTDDVSARKLMISSFLYLPLIQIIYVLDRFLFPYPL